MLEEINELKAAAKSIRAHLLRLCSKQVIHIGGDLSVCDVMTVLWQYQMNYDPKNIQDEQRDRFVLSKGHASAVTSFNQAALGCVHAEDVINEYAADGGRFSMHSCNLVNPYVEVSTGSLGHGFPIACGIAKALRMKGNMRSRVYVIMGDGEQEEGSIWEAAMSAVQFRLGNITAVIDHNGLQADGRLESVSGLGNISDKYKAFGWNVMDIDGHNIVQIKEAFDCLPDAESDIPTAIICHTIKGKGVSFMENNEKWHAGKLNREQYIMAMRELGIWI